MITLDKQTAHLFCQPPGDCITNKTLKCLKEDEANNQEVSVSLAAKKIC